MAVGVKPVILPGGTVEHGPPPGSVESVVESLPAFAQVVEWCQFAGMWQKCWWSAWSGCAAPS